MKRKHFNMSILLAEIEAILSENNVESSETAINDTIDKFVKIFEKGDLCFDAGNDLGIDVEANTLLQPKQMMMTRRRG